MPVCLIFLFGRKADTPIVGVITEIQPEPM